MTGLSDGEILAGILCLLDANPDSHPFFAAPVSAEELAPACLCEILPVADKLS